MVSSPPSSFSFLAAFAEFHGVILRGAAQHFPAEFLLVVNVLRFLALLNQVERRLGNVDIAVLHQLRHLAIKKGEQEGADVRAVHVRVGHDDDLAIAELGEIEIVFADAGSQRRDQGANFFVAQHLVEPRLLHVQDFSAQRQDGLVAAVAALLGGAAGGVALHQEQFATLGIALLAIGELAGQAAGIERALAPREFAGFARGLAGARGVHGLGANLAAHGGVLFKILHQLLVDEAGHDALDIAIEFSLGLPLKLRLRQLHAHHGHQAFAHILALEVLFHVLEEPLVLPKLIDGPRQRGAEAGKVGAAIDGVDVVGKGKNILRITVVVLERELHVDVVAVAFRVDRRGVKHFLVFVEVLDEFGDAAVVMKLALFVAALILEADGQPFIQERHFAQALGQRIEVEFDRLKYLRGQAGK